MREKVGVQGGSSNRKEGKKGTPLNMTDSRGMLLKLKKKKVGNIAASPSGPLKQPALEIW